MQMGEKHDVDFTRLNAQFALQMVVYFQTPPFFAFVVEFRRALFVAQPGIDENLVVAGIHEEAIDRIPDFFAGGPFPEYVGAEVGLQPACIDRVYFYVRSAHPIPFQ